MKNINWNLVAIDAIFIFMIAVTMFPEIMGRGVTDSDARLALFIVIVARFSIRAIRFSIQHAKDLDP